MNVAKIQLIATAAFGLEAVAAREVQALGYTDVMVENGRVTFAGDLEAICRANLWLRSADRVLVRMGEFQTLSFEELFQQTRALPWADWLPENAAFPVDGKSVRSQLHSVPDCQAIVKKAIVERLRGSYSRSWFEETGPRYQIEVALLNDIVTLTIDTSGLGLHKRGYRQLAGQAPLKETLAAAMLQLSFWHKDRALIDPFCGTGTIPIEAAFIAQNRAPGLKRSFAAEKWPRIPKALWQEAWQEALDLWNRNVPLHIYGSDIDPNALSLARAHAIEAGVEDVIHFQRLPVADVRSRFKYGHMIANPPYGERLGDVTEIEGLYLELGETFNRLQNWSLHMLTTHQFPERLIGRRWDKSRKLYTGRLECHYFQFFGPRPPRETYQNDVSELVQLKLNIET